MSRSRSRVGARCALAVMLVALAAGCGDDSTLVDGVFTEAEWALIESLSPLPDVPSDSTNAVADDPGARQLGQMFFFEPAAAGPLVVGATDGNGGLGAVGETGKVACVSCHTVTSTWFDDDRSKPGNVSLGADFGMRNAPTLVNAHFYRWFNWSGSADSPWMHKLLSSESDVSHNSTRLDVAHMVYAKYRTAFEAIFGPLDPRLDPAAPDALPPSGKPGDAAWDALPEADRVIVDTVFADYGKALAAYERQLVSRNAPFDRYVAGDTEAIAPAAKRGLKLFVGKAGCVHCHATALFSDNQFHNDGVPQEGPHVPASDTGRFGAVATLLASEFNSSGPYSDDPTVGRLSGLVQEESQRGQFRTKHLRQIAETGPYMHTGAFATLRDVVDFYDGGGGEQGFEGSKDDFLRPLNLSTDEKEDLVAFLQTLTGEPIEPALLEDTHTP